MTNAQYQSLAIVLAMLSLFGSMPILKSGSALLNDHQRSELKAMGPDVLVMAGPLVLLLAAWYSSRYPWPMVVIALIVGGLTIYRFPSKLWKASWPKSARLRLVIGNCVLSMGTLVACLVYISQFLHESVL